MPARVRARRAGYVAGRYRAVLLDLVMVPTVMVEPALIV